MQYGYAGADGADITDVVDRAQAEVYNVTERRASEDSSVLDDLLQPTLESSTRSNPGPGYPMVSPPDSPSSMKSPRVCTAGR